MMRLMKNTFGLLLAVTVAISCHSEQNSNQRTATVRFAMPEGGSAPTNAFLDLYAKKLPSVMFSQTMTPGTILSVDYVDDGRAEATIVPSDVAYLAFAKGTEASGKPHRRLRGIAMLYVNAVHLLVSPRIHFKNFEDLRGKKIGVGPKGGNTDLTIRTILPYLGIHLSEIQLEHLSTEETYRRFAEQTIDAGFIVMSYPSVRVQNVLKDTTFRLAPIEGPKVADLRNNYPFLRPIVIPGETYGNSEIHTIGSNWLLACRDDLSEEIVYRMLRVFFDSIPELLKSQPALRTVTPQNFALTPIPLHPGAARFYREMEILN
jgi:uncharacterized protein